jgi:hypothetical protein
VAAYRVKYGTASNSYNQSMDVGTATTATIPNLTEGNTYYFAVTALDSSSVESVASNEVSSTIVANQPPVVTLTSPASGATATAPATVNLSASASETNGTIDHVEFYNGTTLVGQSTSSPYACSLSLNSAGTYTFKARAYDTLGVYTDSAPATVTVNAPAAVQTASISSVSFASGSGTTLTVAGTPNVVQTVYVSNDLNTWTVLTSSTNYFGTFTVNDTAAASLNQRFYRISDGTNTSNPSGFSKLQIAGISGKQTQADSYLSVDLTNPVCYQGTVTSDGTSSIVDTNATWTDDQYDGSNGAYYLEIASGSYAGLTTDIVATVAATQSLQTADDLSSFLKGGETYKIRKHRTIADVFGANNSAGLKAGTSITAADEVRLFNPVTQTFLRYYYNSSARGWRSSTSSTADASATVLYLDQGVSVRRKAAGAITLVVTGEVKGGQTIVPTGANSNLCANMYPVGTLTLGNCGLYTGSNTSGLVGSTSINNADEVQIWNGSAFLRYFYQTSGKGGTGWRLSSNLSADASGVQIRPGSSFYVIRKSGHPAFNWTTPQPF